MNKCFRIVCLKKINKNLKRIFLPQYCIYKIYLEDFMNKNFIKIVPFIQIKLLKRINLRNSYKINFLNKMIVAPSIDHIVAAREEEFGVKFLIFVQKRYFDFLTNLCR